jgi:hypothetical protein
MGGKSRAFGLKILDIALFMLAEDNTLSNPDDPASPEFFPIDPAPAINLSPTAFILLAASINTEVALVKSGEHVPPFSS